MSDVYEVSFYAKIVGTVVALAAATMAIRKVFFGGSQKPRCVAPEDKDVVIYHGIGRKGMYTPSVSPPCEKLLLYLRMAKVNYRVSAEMTPSSKGKFPWIEYNGQSIADSALCIDFLNETLKIDLNEHLTAEQKAIGRAFQKMLEENTYWTMAHHRWINSDQSECRFILVDLCSVPSLFVRPLLYQAKRNIKNGAHAQGIGRHTTEEIDSIALKDVRAVSQYLGDKKFFFGDKPCEFDCVIYSYMAMFEWQARDWKVTRQVKDEMKNISAYCHRMKELLYPDWNDLVTFTE